MELVDFQLDAPAGRGRFEDCLLREGTRELRRGGVKVLQINVGKLCNQACKHCHVEAGPRRTEVMSWEVMERLLDLAAHPAIETVDITGGAPEMNPHFREFVTRLSALGKELIVRCNLTIVEEPGFEWLPEFYAARRVNLICSLPCYGPENVAKQRGAGVFEKSISAMRKLNRVGYGMEPRRRGLVLDLVFNPVGDSLPPDQEALETAYRRELGRNHGVRFNNLYTLANLPVGRFRQFLRRQGRLGSYLNLLEDAFNAATLEHLMCRNTLSVGWDGRVYDCDFNQMLEMEIAGGGLSVLDPEFKLERLHGAAIETGEHCLGCTAGSGSSCGGALTA